MWASEICRLGSALATKVDPCSMFNPLRDLTGKTLRDKTALAKPRPPTEVDSVSPGE